MISRRSRALGAVLACALAHAASAQQAVPTQPTFDLLTSAHAADSLRRVTARQQAALTKALLAERAKSDTIARQRRELAALTSARARRDSLATTIAAGATAPAAAAPPVPAPAPSTTSVQLPPEKPVHVDLPVPAPAPTAAPALVPSVVSGPTLTGMLQLWLLGGDAGFRNTYRVRRAEVRASGTASPVVAWTLMLDMAKALSVASTATSAGGTQTTVSQGSRVLQDAVVMLQLHPRIRVDIGQQKIPFGIEGFQSSSTLPTVERPLFASDRARGGSFGDMRDIGASVRGRIGGALDYNLGAYNGSGESQNDVDANLAKSVVAHLAFRPVPMLLVGASGVSAGHGAGDAPVRDRLGVETRVQVGRAMLQAEAVNGHDGGISRQGMYALAGIRLRPALELHARFDSWDPDHAREEDAASVTERDYLGGLTWNVQGLKIQADAVHRTYSAELLPSRWQLLVNLQTNW
jgi:hypothetical protein